MSSKKYASPLRLEVKASRILFVFLFVLHFIAAGLFYFFAFNGFISLFAVIVIISSAYLVIQKHALKKSPSAIVKLVWDGDNDWFLETKNGKIHEVKLMPDTYIYSRLSILLFRPETFSLYRKLVPFSVILLNDNVEKNEFRRLRVRMKVGKPLANT